MTDIKATIGGTSLKPRIRFDNSPGRDNSMYNLSDVSNLDQDKYARKYNELDRYLDIENILPHQNTLARGYQKGSHYDYIASGQMIHQTEMSSKRSGSNFHTRRLSVNKIAKMMGDTFSKLNTNKYITSGPTKSDTFRSRSKTIINSAAYLPVKSGVNFTASPSNIMILPDGVLD